MATKVISFGCKPPSSGADLVNDQIVLAHRYYNKLIELHRKRVDEYESLRREMFPNFAIIEQACVDADAEVTTLIDAIRAANAKARRKRASPAEGEQLKQSKDRRKELWSQRKEILAAINVAMKLKLEPSLQVIYEAGKIAKKEARKTCGVYWGTYQKVESAVEDAVKKTIGPPNFKRWTGDGQIAVQVQGGASWQDMLAYRGNIAGLIQGEPLPTTRVSPRRARPWRFKFRVSSNEKGRPVWIEVMAYVQVDRIPDDARIMGVALVRKSLPPHRMSDGKFHPRYDWSLQFTIRTGEMKPRASSGVCGVDLGWRMIDGNLRVAYLVGDDGHIEELTLPASLLSRWGKSRSLQGIRDRIFDEAKAKLIEWKQGRPDDVEPPEWFAESAKTVGQWKAKGKLARLIDQWGENRMPDDDDVLALLRAWREQDVHLWQWQVDNERKAQRTRLDIYRSFAHRVSQRYGAINVEDCDWRQLARKKPADDNTADAGVKEYMRIASVGKIRELLKQVGGVMVKSVDTTRTCHACGSIEEWDQAELNHTCEVCNLPWDQDYNAAVNLMRSERPAADKTADPDRKPEGDGVDAVANGTVAYVGKWKKRKDARSKTAAETGSV